MKIGIDIDEVLVEFSKGYLKLFNKKFRKNKKFEDLFSYNFWEPLEISKKQSVDLADEFYNTEGFENMGLVENACKGVKNLALNHEIFFITSRPEKIKNKTQKFLEKHFNEIDYKLSHTGDFFKGIPTKAELAENLNLDFFIEDNKNYAKEIAGKGVRVLLLDKPWNENFEKENENILKIKN